MRNWNYRVLHFMTAAESWYAIHEVFYDETGKPTAYGENAAIVGWEASEPADHGIKILRGMRVACAKPVLKASDFDKTEG